LRLEEIEKEKILATLKIYIQNNLNIEDIKCTQKENLKSGRLNLEDDDIITSALLDSYLEK
jgi:hypothetical protein